MCSNEKKLYSESSKQSQIVLFAFQDLLDYRHIWITNKSDKVA